MFNTNLALKNNYFLRIAIGITFVLIEFSILFWFKDLPQARSEMGGLTFSEYMRLHGGIQFFIAAYIQKIVIIVLFSYPILVSVLWAKKEGRIYMTSTKNSLQFSCKILTLNFVTFFTLLAFYLGNLNPLYLINNPLSVQAIFYTILPAIWLIYIFSVLDIIFPVVVPNSKIYFVV